MKNPKLLAVLLLSLAATLVTGGQTRADLSDQVVIDADVLADKIRGAWAGQTIGVSYGFPVEFKYNSALVPDSHKLLWYEGYLTQIYKLFPEAYDDIYVDLTFMQVLEEKGYDAPAQAYADALAQANFTLMHANQTARHNVLAGLSPPDSGHWLNNPTADDIDFQIEADFIGIMHPGMPNSAAAFSDEIGHIMSYGDGWYGGVFVAALYSLAMVENDVGLVVREALKTIPKQSLFYQTISDTIRAYEANPDDWHRAWFDVHQKWGYKDRGPDGAFGVYNIDAKINSAWVVLGLLYGNGDFSRTIEIATRAGDDSDCNPATAAGVLGVILGYSKIPDYWKQYLPEIEDINFLHTELSLNDSHKLSYKHALKAISRHGGKVEGDRIQIKVQKPEPVRFEQSFAGHYPTERVILSDPSGTLNTVIQDSFETEFTGTGFVLLGRASPTSDEHHTVEAELYVDGKKVSQTTWPTEMKTRKFHLFWAFELENRRHKIEVKVLNPSDKATVTAYSLVAYGPSEPNVDY
jgi:hypothetical protein